MAGFGWHSSSAGPGVEVSTDKQTLTRPTDGGGGSYASGRGSAGRKKGRRYFEVDVGASCSVGIVDINADLDALLGNGASPSQWGFSLQNGYFYYRDSGTNGSSDKGTGAVAASVIGVLVDFDANTLTLYDDGVELFTESISFAVDTVLYPAASLGTGDSAALNTQEPFQYPPAATHIPWDKSDLALGSKVSGTLLIDGNPAARLLKAFSFERLSFDMDGQTITESRPLGQTVSDATTGDYEIVLRDGFPREVFVVAFDDYGAGFEANAGVIVGNRVHPTTPNGYVYECTGAGDLPSTEPNPWPTDTEASHSIGTASFDAKPFYRPMVHGPITPQAIDWTPATLFALGESGVWLDPSDLSTMFKDTGGTDPVTADGDAVALMLDKSGNGNHVSQSESSRRPIYRTSGALHWLEFDGSNDYLEAASAPAVGHGDGLTFSAAADFVDRTSTNNTIIHRSAGSTEQDWWFKRRSGLEKELDLADDGKEILTNTMPDGEVHIVTRWDGGKVIHRINGAQDTVVAKPVVMGGASDRFTVGSRMYSNGSYSNHLSGKIYALVARGADTAGGSLLSLEDYLASKRP
ncbi:SPRY domain-containing protein [Spongiibacter sp. UBA1325]|uniref:SPRY domain-containing protein n=1 Tax=Spongiibacter sp. UBA1325 TaxID=1947543 RepID=UPI002580CD2E|nr:SPRY domain-containing protein [Spongiibacter sp. UBA1325]|tara:strand:- start:7354 stop:9090 length:1737 start_codon:yes stop_codon:yes gene_type:complete